MPRISIIVPVYNVEKYIRDCIDSMRAQTLTDIEIICVDDGSPDGCPAILDAYAAKDARIRVIHKKNGGVSAARNDGLAAAAGDYVIFCDSDDMLERDACEALVTAADRTNADVAVGDVYRIIRGEKIYSTFWRNAFTTSDRKILDALVRVDFSRKYCHDTPEGGPAFGYGGPWNKAVRRDFLERARIRFDESLGGIFDDILYTAYLYAEARTVTYVQSPVYDYRILEGSVTHSYKENILEINEAIFAAWEEFLRKYGSDGRFDAAYDVLVIRRLKGTLGTYFFNEKNPLSTREQVQQLKKMLKTEPYRRAVRRADRSKLINSYDQAVWMMARFGPAFGLRIIYRMFVRLKSRM